MGSKTDATRKFFVRHVNPKFIHFDRPFLLAFTVFIFSAAIFGIILWQLLIQCKTTQVSKIGADKSQVMFIASHRHSGAQICLHSSEVYSTFTSDYKSLEVLQANSCVVGEGFISNKWTKEELGGVVPKKLLPFAEEGLEFCDDALFKNQEECDKFIGGICPPCDPSPAGSSGSKPRFANTVFNLVYEETVCPSNSHMIGVALSYTNQCDALLSLLIVFFLMAPRLVHQLGPNGKEGLCAAVKAQVEADVETAAEDVGRAAVNAA